MSDRVSLLAAGRALGLEISDAQADQLLSFRDELATWNKVYNLTALRDKTQMLSHHIIDSLAALPAVMRYIQQLPETRGISILDVGSGGGLPGVVWAIMLSPEVNIDCIDAVGKKAAFVQQMAAHLKLKNLRGIHARVQDRQLTTPYDLITSRAFSNLADFTDWTQHLLKPTGPWLALKGKISQAQEELNDLATTNPAIHASASIEKLIAPGLDAERCLVWLRKTT